jgi:hypothetical protein
MDNLEKITADEKIELRREVNKQKEVTLRVKKEGDARLKGG